MSGACYQHKYSETSAPGDRDTGGGTAEGGTQRRHQIGTFGCYEPVAREHSWL